MKKGKKLYEGKAKIIYATNDKDLVIQYFKDDATAFNNQKKSTIEGKGVVAEGFLKDRNYLKATKILAKHDENYMPPEVKEALKEK